MIALMNPKVPIYQITYKNKPMSKTLTHYCSTIRKDYINLKINSNQIHKSNNILQSLKKN